MSPQRGDCTPTTPLSDGLHTVLPTATDVAGNRTEGAPISLTIDTQGPTAPVITNPADGSTSSDNTPTFSGTGGAGDTITLTESGNTICTTTVGTNGQWSCTPVTVLTDGQHTVLPTATDPAGNRTEGAPVTITIDATAPTAPVITTPADGSTIRDCQGGRQPNTTERAGNRDCTVPFAGTGVPGTWITVMEGRKVICTARVNANGKWACKGRVVGINGKHTFVAVARDTTGSTVRSEPVTVTLQARNRPHHKGWPTHRPHGA
ncbi:Ig-like domain-containing protein [Streptomyces goshikiensis]|uniref:Ig-like domain-containing protein n=1 Tax=Streptomyces goshikiensis TaxID=1942 RepID=UPI0037BA1A65